MITNEIKLGWKVLLVSFGLRATFIVIDYKDKIVLHLGDELLKQLLIARRLGYDRLKSLVELRTSDAIRVVIFHLLPAIWKMLWVSILEAI